MLLGAWLGQYFDVDTVLMSRSGYNMKSGGYPLAQSNSASAVRCDVSAAEEVASVINPEAAKVAWRIHAGGILRDRQLLQQTVSSLRSVFAPKINFLAVSASSARLEALQIISMFSSISAFIGSPGQCNYAAANSVLNAWAEAVQMQGISGELCAHTSPLVFKLFDPLITLAMALNDSCRK